MKKTILKTFATLLVAFSVFTGFKSIAYADDNGEVTPYAFIDDVRTVWYTRTYWQKIL